jgi:hypothetical protein
LHRIEVLDVRSGTFISISALLEAIERNQWRGKALIQTFETRMMISLAARTALLLASGAGHFSIGKLLLESCECNVNLRHDLFDYTALSNAALSGHKKIVDLLLERKEVDVNSKNKSGNTVLSILAAHDAYASDYLQDLQQRDEQ